MIEVELPDGSIAEFPEGTTPDVIKSVLQKRFASPSVQGLPMAEAGTPVGVQTRAGPGMSPEDMQANLGQLSQMTMNRAPNQNANPERTDNYIRAEMEARKIDQMKGNGAFGDASDSINPMGWADEAYSTIVGAPLRMMRDGVGYDEAYTREQLMQEALKRNREERSPIASTIGKVAGDLVLPGAVSKAGFTVAGKSLPVIGKTLPLMGEAAGYGYVQGAGDAKQGEKMMGGLKGAAVSAATAGLVSKAGDIGMGIANKVARRANPAPSTSQIFQKGSDLYDEAKIAGVLVKPQGIQNINGNVKLKMQDFDLDPVLRPKTSHLVSRIEAAAKANKPMSLMELENLRKQAVRITQDATEASEKAAAGNIIESIDTAMQNNANFTANSNQGIKALTEARQVWKTARKSEILDTIAKDAQLQATGFENGLVIQMRALAKNKAKMKAFTPEEQAAIRKLASRGSVRQILAMMGRLSPTSTFGGMTTGGALFGSGVLPAAALGGTGWASKKAAEAMTRSKFGGIQEMVARGAGNALPQAVNKLAKYAIPSGLTATGLLSPRLQPSPQKAR